VSLPEPVKREEEDRERSRIRSRNKEMERQLWCSELWRGMVQHLKIQNEAVATFEDATFEHWMSTA